MIKRSWLALGLGVIAWAAAASAGELKGLYSQLPTGQVVCWLLSASGTQKSGAYLVSSATAWRVKAVNDIDQDGVADVVWQTTTGEAVVWFMNSSGTLRSSASVSGVPTSWEIKAAGDINKDGIADLFWQLPTGQAVVWFMNTNGAAKSSANISGVASTWQIRGAGDINRDGIADLIWQLPTGQIASWFMNTNGTLRSSVNIYTNPTSWRICAVGDIDDDGSADLIVQLPTGESRCWFINTNGTIRSSGNISSGASTWQVRCAGSLVTGTIRPAPVARTGQTISYWAGDDGAMWKGVTWPNPRFNDNGNGTVTDNLTGLVWLKHANALGTRTWAQALSDCATLNSGECGLTDGSSEGDWRLPNVQELQSLIDYSRYNPALCNTFGTGHWTAGNPFTDVASGAGAFYWSSTTYVASPSFYAWRVSMYGGGADVDDKPVPHCVWPVRGGQSAIRYLVK